MQRSSPHKRDRLTELLREQAARFVNEVSNRTSLVTVTRVSLSDNKKYAKILVTVLPEEREVEAMEFLKRQTGDFVESLRTDSRIGIIPFIAFALDTGEKNRQRIDAIMRDGNGNEITETKEADNVSDIDSTTMA